MTGTKAETKIRLRVPDDCRAITLGGEPLPIDADGSLETDAATATALEAHGAVAWQDDPPAAEIAMLPREKLVDLFMARMLAAVKAQDTETIRASLLDGEADTRPPVTRDEVARMNRAAVLSFLRERDVVPPDGASLTELRGCAVETLEA